MDTLEYISLREAAQVLGITLRAVRGRVKSRNIPLVTVTGKHGDRYVLLREHLSSLGEVSADEVWSESGTVPDPGESSARGDWTLFKTVPGEGYKTSRPPQGHDADTVPGNGDQTVSGDGDSTPSDTVPGDGHARSAPGQTIPVQVHLAALETTRQAIESAREAHARADQAVLHAQQLERATWSLQSELSNYRRALTDQAESLAEREALNRQAAAQQALLAQLETQREEALELLAEKARQDEEKEQETQRLAEALRQAESRVSWLEQKVPGWLRKMLGA